MKTKKILLIALVALGLITTINSCRNEPILPEEQVSFMNDVQPIIRSNCQHSGCHGTIDNGADQLDTYNDMMSNDRVVAGQPHSGTLFNYITATSGENMMPRAPYPHLTDRHLRFIYIWIAEGAKDN